MFGVLHAQKKIAPAKQKRKNCSCLETVDHGGQKNRIGKTTTVLFFQCFYASVMRSACLLIEYVGPSNCLYE